MPEVGACGVCHSTDLQMLLDLGSQPLAERMDVPPRISKNLPELWYPLKLLQCQNCSLAQLSYAVDQRVVFPENHPYATGNTRAMVDHFDELAISLSADLRHNDLVIDIGANDGTLLKAFSSFRVRRVAVEPTDQALKMTGKGITVYPEFFTAELADRIYRAHGPAKLITACNVLAHVPDVHNFMAGVAALLSDDGVFVTENHDLFSITDGVQIDVIYHEHQRFWSLPSLSFLLLRHHLIVSSWEKIDTQGGSFRVHARRWRSDLADRAGMASRALHMMLADAAFRGKKVWGIGAATRGVPLIHYFDIARYIEKVTEVSTSDKIGSHMPGTTIEVVDDKELIEAQPEYALLLAWHIADSLMPKLRKAGYKGTFIIPLPEARFADG